MLELPTPLTGSKGRQHCWGTMLRPSPMVCIVDNLVWWRKCIDGKVDVCQIGILIGHQIDHLCVHCGRRYCVLLIFETDVWLGWISSGFRAIPWRSRWEVWLQKKRNWKFKIKQIVNHSNRTHNHECMSPQLYQLS